MEKVIEFLTVYWRQILEGAAIIISLVFCLVRKRPYVNKIDAIKEDVLEMLPSIISMVEVPGEGERKKSTVMAFILDYAKKKYKIDLSFLSSWLEEAIESILSTPEKKGE